TPLELVISAVRAVDAQVEMAPAESQSLSGGAFTLARQVARLGEPLYEAQPPTGHPDGALAWVNTRALLGRVHFALALAQAELRGVRVDWSATLSGTDPRQPKQALDRLIMTTLYGEISNETRAILQAEVLAITRVSASDRTPRTT